MARVTVEDCVLKVPNRFELVMLAARRAKDLASGSPLTLERDNDKDTVVSLREIAEDRVSLEVLNEALVRGHQKAGQMSEPEEEIVELMAGEQSWAAGEEDMADGMSIGEGDDDDAEGDLDAAESEDLSEEKLEE